MNNDEVNYEDIEESSRESIAAHESSGIYRHKEIPWQQFYATRLTQEAKAKYSDHVYAHDLEQHRREYTSNIADLIEYLEQEPTDYLEHAKRNLVIDNNLHYMVDFIKWSIEELEKHVYKNLVLPTTDSEVLSDPEMLIQRVCTICMTEESNDWENYGVKGFWYTLCTYEDTAMEYLEPWNKNIEHQSVSFE